MKYKTKKVTNDLTKQNKNKLRDTDNRLGGFPERKGAWERVNWVKGVKCMVTDGN